jgi:hypothetical protein
MSYGPVLREVFGTAVAPLHPNVRARRRVLTFCVRSNTCRKVDSPGVFHGFSEFDSHCPLAVLHEANKANMRDLTFLLFAGTSVHNHNSLALLYPGGQRQRSAGSVYRKHACELIEKFPEHVLTQNMHAHRQRGARVLPFSLPIESQFEQLHV